MYALQSLAEASKRNWLGEHSGEQTA